MKKILPMCKEVIPHAPLDTFILSILQSYEETQEWELYHFLHMAVTPDLQVDYFYPKMIWDVCPFIRIGNIPYSYIKKESKSAVEFIKWAIQNNSYIYLLLNMKYIKEYNVKEDNDHNPLIFGFDEEKQVIYLQDFIGGIYQTLEISFQNIEDAFQQLIDVEDYNKFPHCGDLGPVSLLRYNAEAKFEFNIAEFRNQLKYYQNGVNFHVIDGVIWKRGRENGDAIFGHNVYAQVAEGIPTKRVMSLLYKHASYWKRRIEYLQKKDNIPYQDKLIKLGDELLDKSKINLYYFLKLQCSGKLNDELSRRKLQERITECAKLDNEIVEYLMCVIPQE